MFLSCFMARKSTRKLWAEHIARGGGRSAGAIKAEPFKTVQFEGLVLGIDPSLRGSGFAVLDYKPQSKVRIVETATLKLKANITQIECLGAIGHQVEDFINQHNIRHVAIEQTAQILGAARGAAIASASMRGLLVFEYAPLRIKQAITGAGRASKEQVARTLQGITGTDMINRLDESDAAAVALCHAYTWRGE
jgi:crossover junction endodeoxyribonuclease RuvC